LLPRVCHFFNLRSRLHVLAFSVLQRLARHSDLAKDTSSLLGAGKISVMASAAMTTPVKRLEWHGGSAYPGNGRRHASKSTSVGIESLRHCDTRFWRGYSSESKITQAYRTIVGSKRRSFSNNTQMGLLWIRIYKHNAYGLGLCPTVATKLDRDRRTGRKEEFILTSGWKGTRIAKAPLRYDGIIIVDS
jgi:hypothetical protein